MSTDLHNRPLASGAASLPLVNFRNGSLIPTFNTQRRMRSNLVDTLQCSQRRFAASHSPRPAESWSGWIRPLHQVASSHSLQIRSIDPSFPLLHPVSPRSFFLEEVLFFFCRWPVFFFELVVCFILHQSFAGLYLIIRPNTPHMANLMPR